MKTLRLNKLKINYGSRMILEDFSLAVDSGDLLVILGPSGCGKSTLLYSIAGLLKPAGGRIAFDGRTVFSGEEGIDIPPEKRNIGFVFQDYSLWPHMSVFENIAYPLRVRGMKKAEMKSRADRLLESVSLSDKRRSLPSALSGGEKQRVAIARAVAVSPDLMLLDEPLANIDAALKTQLLSLISQLKRELNIPMIYVTHDQKEAFEIASRMVVMESGRILQDGCPRQIYRHPKNRFVAGFVGENNLLECRRLANPNPAYAPEDLLVVRPEDIRILKTGAYSGVIRTVVYKGSYFSLRVHTRAGCVIINVTGERYRAGDSIRFDIGRAHVLRGQARPEHRQ